MASDKQSKRYEVRLLIPTYLWASVDVNAGNKAEAELMALQSVANGQVDFEYCDYDTNDARVSGVTAHMATAAAARR